MLGTLDIMLLIYLNEHKSATTTTMAKDIYNPSQRQELVKYDNGIRARLKNLVKSGLVNKLNGEKSVYSLNKDNVYFGHGKLYLPLKGRSKVYVDIGDFIAVKTVDGDFYLRRLNENNGSGVKKEL